MLFVILPSEILQKNFNFLFKESMVTKPLAVGLAGMFSPQYNKTLLFLFDGPPLPYKSIYLSHNNDYMQIK